MQIISTSLHHNTFSDILMESRTIRGRRYTGMTIPRTITVITTALYGIRAELIIIIVAIVVGSTA